MFSTTNTRTPSNSLYAWKEASIPTSMLQDEYGSRIDFSNDEDMLQKVEKDGHDSNTGRESPTTRCHKLGETKHPYAENRACSLGSAEYQRRWPPDHQPSAGLRTDVAEDLPHLPQGRAGNARNRYLDLEGALRRILAGKLTLLRPADRHRAGRGGNPEPGGWQHAALDGRARTLRRRRELYADDSAGPYVRGLYHL